MGKKSKKNVEPVKDEFAQMIAEFDVDGDGILTRDELLFALNTYLTEKSVAGDKKAKLLDSAAGPFGHTIVAPNTARTPGENRANDSA